MCEGLSFEALDYSKREVGSDGHVKNTGKSGK
jgi:hypothetical protein